MNDRLGFVGTGTITDAVVSGFVRTGIAPERIVVSPRNPRVAQSLARRFDGLRIGASNQDVLDRSDVVFLAIRPQIAAEVLEPLHFSPRHAVVSFVAMLPLAEVKRIAAPARLVSRATPLPMVSQGLGPIIILSEAPEIVALLGTLGAPVPAFDERQLDVLLASTALMSSYFGALAAVAHWLCAHDVPAETATICVASMVHGLGVSAQDRRDKGMEALRVAFATPGGINEQMFRQLSAAGMQDVIAASLDRILTRLRPSEQPSGRRLSGAAKR